MPSLASQVRYATPAQAEILVEDERPTVSQTMPKLRQDSRLRGNDGTNGAA
ncbi:hypothetical protein ACLD9W_10550 [Neisseria sp. WLZKY-1]|uniref:hypothetical protein n=1 Tax=Neisseria sp. WLZKY-1 TaxID=3390377 RepID=UPI00397B4CDA